MPVLHYVPTTGNSIAQKAGCLTVVLTDKDLNRGEWSYRRARGEFSCGNGALTLKRSGTQRQQGIAFAGPEDIDVYRTPRYVLVNTRGVSAGMLAIVPMARYFSEGACFKLVEQ